MTNGKPYGVTTYRTNGFAVKLGKSGRLCALLVGLLVHSTVGCAHEPERGSWRQCRIKCEEHRGPVMTWYGGPTVAPGKHQTCMDRCRTWHSL